MAQQSYKHYVIQMSSYNTISGADYSNLENYARTYRESYEMLADKTYGCMVRMGYSEDNPYGSALVTKEDYMFIPHTYSLNYALRYNGEGNNYFIGYFYETQATTPSEALVERNYIESLYDRLYSSIGGQGGRKYQEPYPNIWILVNQNSNRTRNLTKAQREAILTIFGSHGKYKYGICTSLAYARTLTGLHDTNHTWWVTENLPEGAPEAPTIANTVIGAWGYDSSLRFNPFSSNFKGSYWMIDVGIKWFVLPGSEYYYGRNDKVYVENYAITYISNQENAPRAYKFPCPYDGPVIKEFTLDNDIQETGKYIYYEDGMYNKLVLIRGVHYDINYYSCHYYESSTHGYPHQWPTSTNPYINKELDYVRYKVTGKTIFEGEYYIECDWLGSGPFKGHIMDYPEVSLNEIVKLSKTEYEYTGNPIIPTISMISGPKCFFSTSDFVVTARNNINAGTATATIYPRYYGLRNIIYDPNSDRNPDYIEFNFTIKGSDISKSKIVIDPKEYYYTGSAITPNFSVPGFTKNVDYSYTLSNNVNPGTATITCTAIAPNKGTLTATFSIVKEPLNHLTVNVNPSEVDFTGEPITNVTVSIPGLTSGRDFTYTISNNRDIGFAKVVCTATSSCKYTGTAEGRFKIKQISSDTIIPDISFDSEDGNMFTGFDIIPIVTLPNNPSLIEGEDYKVDYIDNINVRSEYNNPRVRITGLGNITGYTDHEFDIEPRDISSIHYAYALPSPIVDFDYEGCRIAYYENEDGRIYNLTYEKDIIIEETRCEYEYNPYSPFFIFYQKFAGLGNFVGEGEYNTQIMFDPSDPGIYDYGIIELGEHGCRAVGNWDFGFQENDYTLIIDPDAAPITDPEDPYRYDFNVLSGDPDNPFYPGREFVLEDNTPVFVEAYSILPFDHRSGPYFVYASLITNNRIKMTDSPGKANKAGMQVCWVNVSDLNKIGIITVGDKVLVNGKLYRDSSGGGGYITKTDEIMYVVKALNTTECDYPLGLATESTSELLGYASEDSVTELND